MKLIQINGADFSAVAVRQVEPAVGVKITVVSNNNEWGTVSGGGRYEEGESVQISATPQTGYKFVSWNDGNTLPIRNIIVGSSPTTYTATFAALQTYSLSRTNALWKGTTIGTSISDWSYQGYSTIKIPCNAMDIFSVKSRYEGVSCRNWCFVDGSDTILSMSEVGVAKQQIVTAPSNSAYLVVNSFSNDERFNYAKEGSHPIDVEFYYGYWMIANQTSIGARQDNGNYVSTDKIQCSVGDQYKITGKGGSNGRLWAFIDSEGNILSRANDGATAADLIVTAPANSAFVVFNSAVSASVIKAEKIN